ncbi:MAG: indole-3-glycerol phosphate synthase TrpC [Lachnospiraceae bacterium]|nr:indole-3-glycerol phosphate synthase TrpC [Lachnospiraceae bacterium]
MILDEIAEKTRERVAECKKSEPLTAMRNRAEAAFADELMKKTLTGGRMFPFREALAAPGITFICEVKKASPSKGLIAPDFPYLQIAKEYEAAGAGAISCLTEPYYFLGSDRYVEEISRQVSVPVLRKDFTVDEYMIYQAKAIGASAVLLICSLLEQSQLEEYLVIAHGLGLSALVEAHDEAEVEMALRAGAGIIGVNNRNLKDFTVDTANSVRLRKLVPENVLFVSESGIKTADDVAVLANNGTNAVLIGETLMRSPDKVGELKKLRSKI